MYKPSLRHIHDPVLLSLKVEVICYINVFLRFCANSVSQVMVSEDVEACCVSEDVEA